METNILEKLAPLKRRAWKPVVEEGTGSMSVSKFAGQPLLVGDESHPVCPNCERPLQLFLQLNLDDLPAEIKDEYGEGIVQLFYCTSEEPLCEVDCQAFFPFAASVLARLIKPENINLNGFDRPLELATPSNDSQMSAESIFPPKRIVGWEALDDYPNSEEAGTLGIEFSDDEIDEYYETDHPLVGDKLAGYSMWVQGIEYPNCPVCGELMRLLFQIDSEDNLPYMFGDVGCAHLTQCATHKEQLAFAWACS